MSEGKRFLVEHMRPRGMKNGPVLDGWLKEVAPSAALRRWFTLDPAKSAEFQRRYQAELDANPEGWEPLLRAVGQGGVTLLCSARDMVHNNALSLKA